MEAAHGFRSYANGLAAIGAPPVVAQRAAATIQPGLVETLVCQLPGRAAAVVCGLQPG